MPSLYPASEGLGLASIPPRRGRGTTSEGFARADPRAGARHPKALRARIRAFGGPGHDIRRAPSEGRGTTSEGFARADPCLPGHDIRRHGPARAKPSDRMYLSVWPARIRARKTRSTPAKLSEFSGSTEPRAQHAPAPPSYKKGEQPADPAQNRRSEVEVGIQTLRENGSQ